MKLPALTAREVDRVLSRGGFVFIRQKGSHRMYRKGRLGVTLPWHSGDLRPKTLRSIIKQSGLSPEEFLDLR